MTFQNSFSEELYTLYIYYTVVLTWCVWYSIGYSTVEHLMDDSEPPFLFLIKKHHFPSRFLLASIRSASLMLMKNCAIAFLASGDGCFGFIEFPPMGYMVSIKLITLQNNR
jgi:hypothetical protein